MAFDARLSPDDDYWEKCARHANRQTSRNVGHLFLCDGCAERLSRDCFNGRPPIYHGPPTEGYCQLCNERTTVCHRQWFICTICLNVVHSYPKSFAASKLVHELWDDVISAAAPELHLEELDLVQIEPYVRKKFASATKAATLKNLDFRVMEGDANTPIFHIEEKTGPGSIDEINEFQLDHNDCRDITTVCNRTRLPAYVFHVQVVEEYRLPSRISRALGLWWTDVFELRDAFIRTAQRRDEPKPAAYFRTSCFKPFDDFVDEMRDGRFRALAIRLKREGCPELFR